MDWNLSLGLPKSEGSSLILVCLIPHSLEQRDRPMPCPVVQVWQLEKGLGSYQSGINFSPESGLLCCSLGGEVITYLFLHPFLYFHLLRLMGLPKQHLFPVAFASSCKWACWGQSQGLPLPFSSWRRDGAFLVDVPAASMVLGCVNVCWVTPKQALDKPGCPVAEALEAEEILQVSGRKPHLGHRCAVLGRMPGWAGAVLRDFLGYQGGSNRIWTVLSKCAYRYG